MLLLDRLVYGPTKPQGAPMTPRDPASPAEQVRAIAAFMDGRGNDWAEQLRAAAARLDALEQALRKFGTHGALCGYGGVCSCGLADALMLAAPTKDVHIFKMVEVCIVCGRTEAAINDECHHCDDSDSRKAGRCWWCLRPVAPAAPTTDEDETR